MIQPNTVCVSIPKRCLITVEMGQATPIGQAIVKADLDLDAPKHIFLMVYILWDRKVNGPASFYFPYYEILPQTLRNMPIFWTADELHELEGSYLLHQIADRNQAIAEDYAAICAVAPSFRHLCTLEEFKWARMCVCSRNFGLCIDGHRTSALVPYADMLNHYRPRETKWTYDEDRQAFTITSLQHIVAGSQVYDSYGQKCNHRFLLNYGFAVENNREIDGYCPNEVPMELYVDPNDTLFAEKLEFWTRGEGSPMSGAATTHILAQTTKSLGQSSIHSSSRSTNGTASTCSVSSFKASSSLSVVKRVRVCVSNNENTRLLFSLLRTLACTGDELQAISSPIGSESVSRALFGISDSRGPSSFLSQTTYHRSCRDVRHPISIRNERAAMRLLLKLVSRHLSQYPTSLSQDYADLKDEALFPLFSNKRHAKIQVRGEKEVLHHYGEWARTAIEIIDLIEEELKEESIGASVEVQWKQDGGGKVVAEERPGFDLVIRRMEADDSGIHHTIVRYCADVLGHLRREEFKRVRRVSRTHPQEDQRRSAVL